MPILRSAKKALRQTRARTLRNAAISRELKQVVKELSSALQSENVEKARALIPTAYKKIDKAAKRGLIKANTAARKKARLARRVFQKQKAS
jgi:small subunit ribosomal protein S20